VSLKHPATLFASPCGPYTEPPPHGLGLAHRAVGPHNRRWVITRWNIRATRSEGVYKSDAGAHNCE